MYSEVTSTKTMSGYVTGRAKSQSANIILGVCPAPLIADRIGTGPKANPRAAIK